MSGGVGGCFQVTGMAELKASAGALTMYEGNTMGAAASERALSSKALPSIQEVHTEAGFYTLTPRSGNPEHLGDACGLFSCLWMALPTQKVCLCAHASARSTASPPPLLSLVCGTSPPGQADRAPVLYLSDCG